MARLNPLFLLTLTTAAAISAGGCIFAVSTEKQLPAPPPQGYVATNVAVPAGASLVFYGKAEDYRKTTIPNVPAGMLYVYDENDRQVITAIPTAGDKLPDLTTYMSSSMHKYRIYYHPGMPDTTGGRGNV